MVLQFCSSLFIDVVQLLGYEIVHGFFAFQRNLRKEIFFFSVFFFVQIVLRDSFFCPSPSLPSHLGNSAELAKFCRVQPSFNRLIERLVSGVGIDAVRTESVMNRPIF